MAIFNFSKSKYLLLIAPIENVKTLVELKHGVDLERSDLAIVYTDEQTEKLKLDGLKTVYMRGRVHRYLSTDIINKYKDAKVTIIDIPEYFFGKELRGLI